MKGLRRIPRVLKIHGVNDYQVSVLFNNGESRIIDFKQLFQTVFRLKKGQTGYELLEDQKLFAQIEVMGSTVGWKTVGLKTENEFGELEFYPFDVDPIILYQNSEPDMERNIIVGMKIKEARKEAGITQEELARKSGTNKQYISRLENNKSDIELLTLKKIVEAGLGKNLSIQIN